MVTKAKEKAAKQLGVPGKIMIPVQDIIKVEDLEREVAELNKIISEKDKVIDDLKKRLGME